VHINKPIINQFFTFHFKVKNYEHYQNYCYKTLMVLFLSPLCGCRIDWGEEKETEYIFSGPYDAWVQVLKKELDPIRGLLSGKFKLQGDMAKVLKATRAAQELVVSTTMIDTEFY